MLSKGKKYEIDEFKKMFDEAEKVTINELENDLKESKKLTGKELDTMSVALFTMQNMLAIGILRKNLFNEEK